MSLIKKTINSKIVYIVHCVDTEGPLTETLEQTFERLQKIFNVSITPSEENLNSLQNKGIPLNGLEEDVAKCFSSKLLNYNTNWCKVTEMVNELRSEKFRRRMQDDFGGGWVYSWHCMDHVNYTENPRCKDLGYGKIFNYYRAKLDEENSFGDEINWHFHPLALSGNPQACATSYFNNIDRLTQIICRRVIDNSWFPVVNRPGFHSERSDSHAFLEQWVPFDFANQFTTNSKEDPDLNMGRFGDWRRAPKTWRGYHPSHDDYQEEGRCKRIIFRCLNVGTRLRSLENEHIIEAFEEARTTGSAILSIANHDYRDMRPDVIAVQSMIAAVKTMYPDVSFKYAGAHESVIQFMGWQRKPKPILQLRMEKNRLHCKVIGGEIFGPQPFLAIKTREGKYYHDNFDVVTPKKHWTYVFDWQTLELSAVSKIGVGTAGRFGGSCVSLLNLSP